MCTVTTGLYIVGKSSEKSQNIFILALAQAWTCKIQQQGGKQKCVDDDVTQEVRSLCLMWSRYLDYYFYYQIKLY
jgi:hypothetical protein